MKSLLTEQEKQRIRSLHTNRKLNLLKEAGEFFDLEPIDLASLTTTSSTVAATASTCATAPELKTLADEGKFRTWVKATYPNNVVSGVKLSDKRWKNPPTVFCNKALGTLWAAIEPTSKESYGKLYLKTITT